MWGGFCPPRRMWLPPGLRPTAASVASCTSGCATACSHAIPSPTLSQGRTAFPALGYHSSFPSCSKIPVKLPSRIWDVPPQTCNPCTPPWVRVCPHRAPVTWHSWHVPRGDGPGREAQGSDWAAVVSQPAQPSAGDAATWRVLSPWSSRGVHPLHKRMLEDTDIHLGVGRAGTHWSCHSKLSPPLLQGIRVG